MTISPERRAYNRIYRRTYVEAHREEINARRRACRRARRLTQQGNKQRVWPAVTVNAFGKFSLDEATYSALGKPTRIALYWDEDTGTIGMRATETGGRAVQHQEKRWLVCAVGLCKALGIHGQTRPLSATIEDGVLFIETRPQPTRVEHERNAC